MDDYCNRGSAFIEVWKYQSFAEQSSSHELKHCTARCWPDEVDQLVLFIVQERIPRHHLSIDSTMKVSSYTGKTSFEISVYFDLVCTRYPKY